MGPIQRKILIALEGYLATTSSRNLYNFSAVMDGIYSKYNDIDKVQIMRSLKKLSNREMITITTSKKGDKKITLTKDGKRELGRFKVIKSKIKLTNLKKWDKKWRVVAFDIPEVSRPFRDILRNHLKELDFIKLQNSVFISPYPCEKALEELVKIYSAEKYVRVITATRVDNESEIRKKFFK